MKNRAAIGHILLLVGALSVASLPAVAVDCGPEWTFDCGNGKRISPWLMCDGEDHCGNNADEATCTGDFIVCPPGIFACHNLKRCMPPWWVCNGRDDCKDGSDEKDCPNGRFVMAVNYSLPTTPKPILTSPSADTPLTTDPTSPTGDCNLDNGDFSCPDGRCLLPVQVCDGVRDCSDGADEGPLCRFVHRGNQQPQQQHGLRGWLVDFRMQLRVLPQSLRKWFNLSTWE